MTSRKQRIEPGWSYAESEKSAFELEELLERHGITIQSGSAFEAHVLSVMKLTDDIKAGVASQGADVRNTYRTLIGVYELANHILRVKDSPSFESLVPHLRMLNKGTALQNIPSKGTDQATNKLFELLVASFAMRCGSDVVLDDPDSSRGDNPDVLATIGERRWGIACKVLHGVNPEGFITNLSKGLEQIENSPAEVGVVLFNLKQCLPHDTIWPIADIPDSGSPPERGPAAWPQTQIPFDILVGFLDDLGDQLVAYLPTDYLTTMFLGKKSIPGFLLWAHSTSAVLIDGHPAPTAVRALNCREVAPISPQDMAVLKCLNEAAFFKLDG